MHTVIETDAYRRAAKAAGMSEDEMAAVVDRIANDPLAGDIMPGCGGARKLRVARSGEGKSGGYRVVTYFAGHGSSVSTDRVPQEHQSRPHQGRTKRIR